MPGTTIGGTTIDQKALEDCIALFEEKYEDKTGNDWHDRDRFVKHPQKMYPIDIDHGEDAEVESKLLESDISSSLKKPVQDLMRLIFDIESMKKAMLEYEIDMDKMPLGKISKKQIQQAYSVLTELLTLIKSGSQEKAKFIAASNKFYTLIPHNFGVDGPRYVNIIKIIYFLPYKVFTLVWNIYITFEM